MLRLVAFISLAIFLILYGLGAVTNLKIEYMATLCGFAALVAGILWFVLAIKQAPA